MNKIMNFIQVRLSPVAGKISSIRVINIVKNSMMSIINLVILGSLCNLIISIPHEGYMNFISPIVPIVTAAVTATMGILGLATLLSIAYNASKEYNVSIVPGILAATMSFILCQIDAEGNILYDNFGSMGIFTGLVVGIVSVKIVSIFKEKKIVIKMPDSVPEFVSDTFSSLIPMLFLAIVFAFLRIGLKFDINAVLGSIAGPLNNILDSYVGVILWGLIGSLAFFCGINPFAILGVTAPMMIQNAAANAEAFAAGAEIPHVFTLSFMGFLGIGGSGGTIGLCILMLFAAKSQYYKTLGKVAIVPSLFNINEPLIFGVPIMLNPYMFIPFVITPMVTGFLSYLVMDIGLVAKAVVSAPSSLPPGILGFLMSGGKMSTTIWSILLCLISLIIYYPFFRVADNVEYEKEKVNPE